MVRSGAGLHHHVSIYENIVGCAKCIKLPNILKILRISRIGLGIALLVCVRALDFQDIQFI